MNIKLSRLAVVVAVSLSIASVASASSSSPSIEQEDTTMSLNDDLKAPVVTKCIRTYTGSCDSFKVSCKRSGGALTGSCPGDNGELFCWTCTK